MIQEKRQVAPFVCDFCTYSNFHSSKFANHVKSKHSRTISPKVISDRMDWSTRLSDMIQKGLGSNSLPMKSKAKSPGRANTNTKKSPSNKKPVCTLTKVSKPSENSVLGPSVLQTPESGPKLNTKDFAVTENCERCTELASKPSLLRKHRFFKHMTEKVRYILFSPLVTI